MFLRDSNSAEENSTDLGYPKTKADSPKKPFAGSNRVASALFSMCMWTCLQVQNSANQRNV